MSSITTIDCVKEDDTRVIAEKKLGWGYTYVVVGDVVRERKERGWRYQV